MDKFVIDGGRPLSGMVRASGAKNAVLPAMAACLLAPGRSVLTNVPNVMDVRTMRRLLIRLGAKVDFEDNRMVIDVPDKLKCEAEYEIVKQMRASYYVLGPLLARFGKAKVSLPGGCSIGARPIDLHLKGMEALGAKIQILHGYVQAQGRPLKGARLLLAGTHGVSVGATINVMMAAVLAKGITVIESAALEPEVVSTAQMLVSMGADITGAGTPVMTIAGVEGLRPAETRMIPDRIETGSLMIAAAISGGCLTIEDCRPDHLAAVIDALRAMGVKVAAGDEMVTVEARRRVRPIDLTIAPYPGFPTDMQPQMMTLMTIASGLSVITETIFENRFMHVPELQRLGADIKVEGKSAVIKGVPELTGAPVMGSDLRASAALVIAGLKAEGKTEVNRIYHLDRGYERWERKLKKLGAKIRRVHQKMAV
ncbi:MAG: UDP-N-acetylglucosamine 1-carboxyvinyltransferase [Candidatus Edwardsbacteria bacterium RIFOXYD12_FULL_50_11]|uniref:UDP-N-acetylglucosamine 1-carboxyvinyltransferase n=1 Tax=Candidatus Edwardsbacteria bacterium GWF2_54_11 TaxID=1817851 RepID=A0A1F5R7C4_9BACT|nr:MAG: UDP-N-acetylglucosamine 1-carboxyvinyltransferase [Candidatus Edwardsbacteria bacterium RifOxyC12_full_54_24]OGF08307.1 MAG: UDP-N-acetylglucosamine 1-carboxyvinyltransferase [Candidatus Edwardsbacteria bacterium RifOxyA12_full_54_48]OGF10354.1 MAG: UDP-N-acetylglucosamine 1-carboxyvinyltransferase [Candidatus Edwardsbacteria bacterium GWF2_54_11]OGF11604.1 MAG: UDP-N-acetylglucosamine 1-carboxyvinyltransferase [Candidatus Edwardsbacteria bacterium GWE2_54_12]OGF17742.1 MAG: UDP-N-acety